MGREAVLVDHNFSKTVLIMVDVQNANEILPYLFQNDVTKEFKEISDILKENLRNKEKYCKVDVSDKAKDMFEMRFVKQSRNDRIYCKQIKHGKKTIIVMVELFQGKKTQHIPKQIKSRIETMGGYEYELQH